MCTATIVHPTEESMRPEKTAADGAWIARIVFNRDEGRKRPDALPPVIRTYVGVRCLMPVDPVSDGTWIAANKLGLACFLINFYPKDYVKPANSTPPGKSESRPSRGTIIPAIVHARSIDDVAQLLHAIPLEPFAGFRLVVTDGNELLVFAHRTDDAQVKAIRIKSFPQLLVSSGLGDDLVEAPRRKLFDEMCGAGGDPILQQHDYQRHSWPDAPHLSVCMRRAEALTVSQTIVDLFAHRVRMTYIPGPPDEQSRPAVAELDRHRRPSNA